MKIPKAYQHPIDNSYPATFVSGFFAHTPWKSATRPRWFAPPGSSAARCARNLPPANLSGLSWCHQETWGFHGISPLKLIKSWELTIKQHGFMGIWPSRLFKKEDFTIKHIQEWWLHHEKCGFIGIERSNMWVFKISNMVKFGFQLPICGCHDM